MPGMSELTKFSNVEIDTLFKKAIPIIKNKHVVILSSAATKSFGRILIIVKKKVGSAPVRNLLRRRVKHAFYEKKLHLYKKDIIFIARKDIVKLSFQDIENLLCSVFQNDIM